MFGVYTFHFISIVFQNWKGEMSMLNNVLLIFNDLSLMGYLIFIGLSNFFVSFAAGLVCDGAEMSI